jgi:hypothetical protein
MPAHSKYCCNLAHFWQIHRFAFFHLGQGGVVDARGRGQVGARH